MQRFLKHILWRIGQITTLAGVALTFAQIAVRKNVSNPFTVVMSHAFQESSWNVWMTIVMLILASFVLLWIGREPNPGSKDGTRHSLRRTFKLKHMKHR